MLDGWKIAQQLVDGLISFLNTMVQTPAPDDVELPVKLWLALIGSAAGLFVLLVQRIRRHASR